MDKMDKNIDCFGQFNKEEEICAYCDIAVECYEERNNQLMDELSRTYKVITTNHKPLIKQTPI